MDRRTLAGTAKGVGALSGGQSTAEDQAAVGSTPLLRAAMAMPELERIMWHLHRRSPAERPAYIAELRARLPALAALSFPPPTTEARPTPGSTTSFPSKTPSAPASFPTVEPLATPPRRSPPLVSSPEASEDSDRAPSPTQRRRTESGFDPSRRRSLAQDFLPSTSPYDARFQDEAEYNFAAFDAAGGGGGKKQRSRRKTTSSSKSTGSRCSPRRPALRAASSSSSSPSSSLNPNPFSSPTAFSPTLPSSPEHPRTRFDLPSPPSPISPLHQLSRTLSTTALTDSSSPIGPLHSPRLSRQASMPALARPSFPSIPPPHHFHPSQLPPLPPFQTPLLPADTSPNFPRPDDSAMSPTGLGLSFGSTGRGLDSTLAPAYDSSDWQDVTRSEEEVLEETLARSREESLRDQARRQARTRAEQLGNAEASGSGSWNASESGSWGKSW